MLVTERPARAHASAICRSPTLALPGRLTPGGGAASEMLDQPGRMFGEERDEDDDEEMEEGGEGEEDEAPPG